MTIKIVVYVLENIWVFASSTEVVCNIMLFLYCILFEMFVNIIYLFLFQRLVKKK